MAGAIPGMYTKQTRLWFWGESRSRLYPKRRNSAAGVSNTGARAPPGRASGQSLPELGVVTSHG